MKPCRAPALLLAALFAGGCSTEMRSYQVSVRNDTQQPITGWMVKEFGPDEIGWESPEEMGLQNPDEDSRQLPDIVVPPGRAAISAPVPGRFDKLQGRVYLRVYAGTPTLTQMLAMDRNSMSRTDVLLLPGRNAVVVDDNSGYLHGVRVGQELPPRDNSQSK